MRKFLEANGARINIPDDRNFETEGEAIESGLRKNDRRAECGDAQSYPGSLPVPRCYGDCAKNLLQLCYVKGVGFGVGVGLDGVGTEAIGLCGVFGGIAEGPGVEDGICPKTSLEKQSPAIKMQKSGLFMRFLV